MADNKENYKFDLGVKRVKGWITLLNGEIAIQGLSNSKMYGIIHRLSNLQTTGACLLKNMYRYYREKFHVDQFWELKG